MKSHLSLVLLAALLVSTSANATKIPLPVEGATFEIRFQLQTQALINEGGSPDGQNPSYDIFIRRSRLLLNGDIGNNLTWLVQLDNPNFGKYGVFANRAIVQDAWVGWAPTGMTGGTVIFIDAGILLEPISHHLLESTTNFTTADVHTDSFRMPGNAFQGLRTTGVQTRGWALDKKIGWRGGIYEGLEPFDAGQASYVVGANGSVSATGGCTSTGKGAGTCIAPKRNPQFAGYVGFDIIGSEEGGWLYGAYKWGKDPILSVGLAGVYQSQATLNGVGSLTDEKLGSVDVYFNYPMGDNELVFEGTYYRSGNGTASGNTGNGFFVDAGYRYGFIAPYIGYEYFQADDCDPGSLSAAQMVTCTGLPATRGSNAIDKAPNSRNLRAGINLFFAKNTNHLNIEFGLNHGQSSYGPQTETVASAGYVPNVGANGTPVGTSLKFPAYKSLLIHWNTIF